MEQDNLINYLYRRLKNEHLWFVTKTNNNGSYWQTKPSKYYDLDEYGELKNKSKVEKEINDYLGDGAETISEAVSLFIADNVIDGSISQTDYLTMDYKDKPVEYSENAVEVKNVEPKYIEPQITGSNKQVESKQLNETYYNELPSKTGKDLSDFKSMLDTLNNNGKQSRRGKWYIGNGGYDLWYEIYYNGLPVIQCINGRVNNITDKEVFEFYTKLFSDICDYEYDEEIIESKQLNEIAARIPGIKVAKKQKVSENLNTGVLPLINVDMYSIFSSGMLDDVDIGDTTEELDKLVEEIAPKYLEEIISEVLPSVKITPTGVYHPKQYNFSGDELEFNLSADLEEYNNLKDKVLKDTQFASYIKDNFSSKSGFISSMPDNLDDFNNSENWKQLVEVIMFATRNNDLVEKNDDYLEKFIEAVKEEFPVIDEELEESKKTEVKVNKLDEFIDEMKYNYNINVKNKDDTLVAIGYVIERLENILIDNTESEFDRSIIRKYLDELYKQKDDIINILIKNGEDIDNWYDVGIDIKNIIKKVAVLRKNSIDKKIEAKATNKKLDYKLDRENGYTKLEQSKKQEDVHNDKYNTDYNRLKNYIYKLFKEKNFSTILDWMLEYKLDMKINKDTIDVIADKLGKSYAEENQSHLELNKKQEDIFDDVTNGEAVYGVYDDKDIRNYKDRYKEPTYAKRNKIRNFKDDKFKQRSIRDIINKGVTHVDYEKMPNERVQAYKNSKKEENVQRRLEEENNKSLNLISDMFKSKDFDSDSKAGQIVMRTSSLFNALSDKGYDVQVAFDNGESTNTILLGQQGGQIKITITDTNTPLRAFTDGSFELTEDNIKTLEDISKEIKTL